MSNIDQISRVLGELTSDVKHIKDIVDEIKVNNNELSSTIVDLEKIALSNKERLDKIEPSVQQHKKLVNIGFGAFLGVSSVFGFIGSAFHNFLVKVFF